MNLSITIDEAFIEAFQEATKNPSKLSSWQMFQQSYQIAETMKIQSFNELVAPGFLPNFDILPHQLKCAERVIQEMNGRALLADEVGLGKTIEAGFILKELLLRGLVQKVLIIVPASLINQWAVELNQKFLIPAIPASKRVNWKNTNILITTLETAKKEKNRDIILDQDYDLVIVDEAHKLKNHKTKNFDFVSRLSKTYCLLLTATPIQNKLMDIFNLITLLKPGYLGTYEEFKKNYDGQQKQIENNPYLKQLIGKVMVRNRRNDTKITWTKREVETIWVEFTEEESNIYQQLEHVFKEASSLSGMTYMREFCSSREACYVSLKKWLKENSNGMDNHITSILSSIEQLPHHAKALKLLDIVKKSEEKFIIFTEYHASQLYLQWLLHQEGIPCVIYRGGFNKGKKDWMRQLFEHKAQVMIATEAAAEGINLQFCHHLINYDLPWNPMRLEQRIGRVHRFGQKNNVTVYNFAIKNTIDDHIIGLLYKKIHLFENVVGQLDEILANLNVKDLDVEIEQIFTESKSIGETKVKLDNLTSVIDSYH